RRVLAHPAEVRVRIVGVEPAVEQVDRRIVRVSGHARAGQAPAPPEQMDAWPRRRRWSRESARASATDTVTTEGVVHQPRACQPIATAPWRRGSLTPPSGLG